MKTENSIKHDSNIRCPRCNSSDFKRYAYIKGYFQCNLCDRIFKPFRSTR